MLKRLIKLILDLFNRTKKSEKGIVIVEINGEIVKKVIQNKFIRIYENESKTIAYILDSKGIILFAKIVLNDKKIETINELEDN